MNNNQAEPKTTSKIVTDTIVFIASLFVYVYFMVLRFFTHKDYFNRKHLEVVLEGKSLKVKWFSHSQYINYKIDILQKAKPGLKPDEFISLILSECRHCIYVIFNCKDKNKFVQFWLGDGKLMADWPISDKKGAQKYNYAMLGVLNELDIHEKTTDSFQVKRLPFYILKKEGSRKIYEVYFNDFPEKATPFVCTMLTDVYGQKLDDLEFIVQ